MPYADTALVLKMLRSDPDADLGPDVDARIAAIDKAISLALEDYCGCTWGQSTADTTVLHWVAPGDMILLSSPARSITSITTGGTVTGSTMTGGTTSTETINAIVNNTGLIYAITLDGWTGWAEGEVVPVAVTGDFSTTDDDDAVPDDLTYVASYLVAEQYKKELTNGAGFMGPDGIVPLRNAWKDELVQRTLAKYSTKRGFAV